LTDPTALAALSSQAITLTFTRNQPSRNDNSDEWFLGYACQSFPSGEVATVAAAVTPFVLQYDSENPCVYGLETLPIKVTGH